MATFIIDNKEYYYNYDTDSLILLESQKNNIDNNKILVNNKINDDSFYMENINIDFWENLLERKLYKDELKIFHKVWIEKELNEDIKNLQKNLMNSHCYIKAITNNLGNCLFESLASLGLGDNDLNIKSDDMLRKNIASILLALKNEENFFPNINFTPEELFNNINEIEMIKDVDTQKIYIYDYDMMLHDLISNFSWERLPTEFILMAISRIYEIKILIYHNKSNFINEINVWKNTINENIIDTIILGQINEEHYFPVLELPDELKYQNEIIDEIMNTDISYNKYINKYKEWAKFLVDSINHNIPEQIILNKDTNTETKSNVIIMKTNNNLSSEQINDYEQIQNFENFEIL